MKLVILIIAFLFIQVTGCKVDHHLKTEPKSYIQNKIKCNEAISNWCRNYGQYPDSYMPQDFSDAKEFWHYSNGKEVPYTKTYDVRHAFRMKSIKGDTISFIAYFKLDYDFFISIIDTLPMNGSPCVFPPDYAIWQNKFGKAFTNADTLAWKENNRELKTKLSEPIRSSLWDKMPRGKRDSLSNLLQQIK